MCYKLVAAVKTGHLPNAMQEMHCGPLCHARWSTTAQRILFLLNLSATSLTKLITWQPGKVQEAQLQLQPLQSPGILY